MQMRSGMSHRCRGTGRNAGTRNRAWHSLGAVFGAWIGCCAVVSLRTSVHDGHMGFAWLSALPSSTAPHGRERFADSRFLEKVSASTTTVRSKNRQHALDDGVHRRVAMASAPDTVNSAPSAAEIADGRIFVSIAAYFDPELPNTVRSMLHAAQRPELITVGIVWQGMPEEDDIGLSAADLADFAELWGLDGVGEADPLPKLAMPTGVEFTPLQLLGGRLRIIRMPASDARGPCWARYLAQLLWTDEELYLQLDSHMRFAPSWDNVAREQLATCAKQSDRPVLCSYCAGYELGLPWKDLPDEMQMSSLNCAGNFDSDGILLIEARPLKQHWPEPTPSLFWSGQFHFSSSLVLREVPYDPQLQMLFFGEEILTSVRLFTSGWDMYSPSGHIFYHLWDRGYRRVYFKDNRGQMEEYLEGSQRRLHALLGSGSGRYLRNELERELVKNSDPWPLPGGGVATGPDAFGLGSVRELADYEAVAGVNFKDHRVDTKAWRGGAFSEELFHKEDQHAEPPVPVRLVDVPVALTSLAKATFEPCPPVNGRPSYTATVTEGIAGMTPTSPGKYVLWYSSNNATWVMNMGGVWHGIGLPTQLLLMGPGSAAVTPTDVKQWYGYDSYTGRWAASENLRCVEADGEEEEKSQSWFSGVLPELSWR